MTANAANQPDSFYGYVAQIPRALHYLVEGRYYVYIEKYDDISVLDNEKNVLIVEQVKNKDNSNFSNHSSDFWKTFSNWTNEYLKNVSKFTPQTRFILFSNIKKNLHSESFIMKCHNAKNDKEASEALSFIKNNFKSTDIKINEYFDNITKPENQNIIINIIRNFEYKEAKINVHDDVIQFIYEKYSIEPNLAQLKNNMFAWVHERIYDEGKKKLKQFELSQMSFNNYIYPNKNLVLALENELESEDFEKTKDSNFLKQLNLVEIPDEAQKQAQINYLRWLLTKQKFEENGICGKSEFDNMYKNTHDKWVLDMDFIFSTNGSETDVKKGKRLYYKSLEQEIRLANTTFNDNKIHVNMGVCNYIADFHPDNPTSIGWHPNYKQELKKGNHNDKYL